MTKFLTLLTTLVVTGLLCAPRLAAQEADTTEAAAATSAGDPAADDVDGADNAAAGDQEEPEPHVLKVANDSLTVTLTGRWEKVKPRNRMVEHEFRVPPPEAEAIEGEPPAVETDAGRMTITFSGGTIEANMRRWVGQFRLGRDADGEDAMHRHSLEVGPLKVHQLDIAGTFFDMPKGPFGEKVERPDYRMLGAMVETPDAGTWYLKFYGPESLVAENEEAFGDIIETLRWSAPKEAPKPSPEEE